MRAKITVFDEETGQVFAEDKLIMPTAENINIDLMSTEYVFAFKIRTIPNKFLENVIEPNDDLLKAIGLEDKDAR